MNSKGKKYIAVFLAVIAALSFGIYTWFDLSRPPPLSSVVVTVTPGSAVVDQGGELPIYINATTVGTSPFSIDGSTYGNGLELVPVHAIGIAAVIKYNLSEQNPDVVVEWNVSEDINTGGQVLTWLVPAGNYKLTEGALIFHSPPTVRNFTFVFPKPNITVSGINASIAHNSTNVSLNVSSTVQSQIFHTAILSISTEIHNSSTGAATYMNFTRNVTVPETFTLSFKASGNTDQYLSTYYLKTSVGTLMWVVAYGIFQ